MAKRAWQNEDAVALRAFLRRVPPQALKEVMDERCVAKISRDDITTLTPDALARLAAMKSGWEAYQEAFLALAESGPATTPSPEFRDMQ